MVNLSGDESALLADVIAKRKPQLQRLVESERDLARQEAEELVGVIGEEVSDVAGDDDWTADSYGNRLERLLDAVNRHLMR
jgi:hypothetical protein